MNHKNISKAQIKHIRQLQLKKFRQRYKQFCVEGTKSVQEFIDSDFICKGVYALEEWHESNNLPIDSSLKFNVKSKELEQISSLKNPQSVLAVFEIGENPVIDISADLILALDTIQDPGNLGTIIRSADWFGLNQIVCSPNTADCFNPKVIQATMGSLSRVKIVYSDLEKFITSNNSFNLVIADLDGDNYKKFDWGKSILLIGNEGHGVSENIKNLPYKKITIPKKGNAESLNASVSASIILSEVLG